MQPDLIGSRYRVEDAIGKGGMGTVWRARDEKLARQVAVKQVGLLPGESVTDSARALREARSTAALSHRNVVTVFDVVDEDGSIWLVMEHVPSRSLADIIREDGPLPPATVARIGAEVAEGLAAAHAAGIVHRDVKPGNILVRDDGAAKISDFGIARTDGDPALTQAGMFIGTPAYFAPELARGEEPTAAADVWALGASLYAAVEGEPPYELSTNHLAVLSRIADQDPPPPRRADFLEPTIGRMMERDPAFRWSMADAAHALRRLAAWNEEPTDATATGALGAAAATDDDAAQTAAWSPAMSSADAADTSDRPAPGEDVAAGAGWDDQTGPLPERRRRRGPLVALVAALALLVLGGLAFLALGQDDPGATPAADSPASTPTEPTKPKDTERPKEEESPTPTQTPTANEKPAQQQKQAQAVSATDGQAAFIEDYFNTVPEDTDTGWSMLGPGAQAVGRDSYEGWWDSVADVQVSDIDTAPSGDSADVTLTYTMKDGRVETERQRLAMIRSEDGGWLINGDEPA